MGDPRKFTNKFAKPGHPWQRARMAEEKPIQKEYGLKTKNELWKATSALKSFANQAKRLTALRTQQAETEKKQLLERLARLGLLKTGATLDDVLALTVKNLLERRLQTIVMRKGLARTAVQSRQLIVHGHVLIKDKKVSAPSYIVPTSEESNITFTPKSSFANPEHPERTIKKKEQPKYEPRPEGRGRYDRQRRPQRREQKPAAKVEASA